MTEFESITFFIDRCLGNKLIVETLRGAGLTIEIHDDHFIFERAILTTYSLPSDKLDIYGRGEWWMVDGEW